MTDTVKPPWASGPGEILKHGLELLRKDSDVNRRLAMISIDNAVELMVKTYLGLPRRVTGLRIPRSEYQGFAESFPGLLDALEKYANDRLNGIDLGEIEWYHRLRNQLYHQGNGLTVERDKVEVSAELGNVLFTNLFGVRLVQPREDETVLLGEFMQAWVSFEKVLSEAAFITNTEERESSAMPLRTIDLLVRDGFISKVEAKEINEIRMIRNRVVHGTANHKEVLSTDLVKRLIELITVLQKRLKRGRNAT